MSGLDLDLLFTKANTELGKASTWFRANNLTFNVSKTKFMIFSDKDINLNALGLNLKIWDSDIEQVGNKWKEKYFRFVGHVLDNKFSWQDHVQHIFTNITCTDQLKTRHTDYNYLNIPAVKRSLEHFSFSCKYDKFSAKFSIYLSTFLTQIWINFATIFILIYGLSGPLSFGFSEWGLTFLWKKNNYYSNISSYICF